MNLESKKGTYQKLLGYFLVLDSDCGTGIIVDMEIGHNCTDYGLDNIQIFVPRNYNNNPDLITEKSDYFRAGICFDINVGNSPEIPSEIDIPVFAQYYCDRLTGISIEIDHWKPKLKIFNVDEYRLKEKNNDRFPVRTKSKLRKLLGYITVSGGSILIAELDLIKISEQSYGYQNPQIIVPNGYSFRGGVVAPIPDELTEQELENIEYPVYGEYEGKFLKRIFIDYTEKRKIQPFTVEEMKKIFDIQEDE